MYTCISINIPSLLLALCSSVHVHPAAICLHQCCLGKKCIEGFWVNSPTFPLVSLAFLIKVGRLTSGTFPEEQQKSTNS